MNVQTTLAPASPTEEPQQVQLPTRRPVEIRVVTDSVAVLDTARFEHMQRIASVMAQSNLIPDGLCLTKGEDGKNAYLPMSQVVANCFLVVNQAVRWGMDPFAVAQCVSVVHGKLCYEGKLIAAVIEAKLGIRLKFTWNEKQGDSLGIVVSGHFPNENEPRTIEGTVGEWKTTKAGSPWGSMPRKMLAYRGTREWARLYAPGLMLGVYSDDELADLSDDARATRARDVSPARQERLKPPNPNGEPAAPARPKPPNPNGETAAAPAKAPPEVQPPKTTNGDQLEFNLITQIAQMGTLKDCAIWFRETRVIRSGLPADAQGRVDDAFYKQQESLTR